MELTTRAACKAVGMVKVPHGLASLAGPIYPLSTLDTNTFGEKKKTEGMLDLVNGLQIPLPTGNLQVSYL